VVSACFLNSRQRAKLVVSIHCENKQNEQLKFTAVIPTAYHPHESYLDLLI